MQWRPICPDADPCMGSGPAEASKQMQVPMRTRAGTRTWSSCRPLWRACQAQRPPLRMMMPPPAPLPARPPQPPRPRPPLAPASDTNTLSERPNALQRTAVLCPPWVAAAGTRTALCWHPNRIVAAPSTHSMHHPMMSHPSHPQHWYHCPRCAHPRLLLALIYLAGLYRGVKHPRMVTHNSKQSRPRSTAPAACAWLASCAAPTGP